MLVQGGTHKVHHAYPRYFNRILEAEEDTFAAAVFRFEFQQVLSVESNFTLSNFKSRITYQYTAKGTLSRTVRPHDSMYLTCFHRKVDAFQYLFAIHVGM